MILNGKSDQYIGELREVLKDFPVPFRFISGKNGAITDEAIAQAKEEYILVLNDQEIISNSFVKNHRKTAWKGKVISGTNAEKIEPIVRAELIDKIGSDTISFWKEDWAETLTQKQALKNHETNSSISQQDLPQVNQIAKGLSVVIPNYNGRQLFNETIPPLLVALDQSGLQHEIIIVDDCSTDDSVAFLRSTYPQIRVIENEINKGFAPTINRGIFQCKHELVFLLNSDVKLEPSYFKYLIPYFEKSDTFGVMGRIINWEDDQIQDGAKLPTLQGAKIKTFKNFLPRETPVQKGLNTMYLSGAEALVSREKILMLGGFDEIFAPYYIEDYEMCLRAWRLGWKCYYEHRSVCRHKTSSSIKSKSRKRNVQTIYYRNKMFLHAIHLSFFQTLLYYPQSKQRFEALAKEVGTNLSLVKVADNIHHSLEHTDIWRF